MSAEVRSANRESAQGGALAEVARIGRAQRDAALAGRFEEVRSLLEARRRLLERLRGQPARSEEIEAARASDAETKAALEAEVRRVEEELGRLTAGSRALSGYTIRAAGSPAFVDHVR